MRAPSMPEVDRRPPRRRDGRGLPRATRAGARRTTCTLVMLGTLGAWIAFPAGATVSDSIPPTAAPTTAPAAATAWPAAPPAAACDDAPALRSSHASGGRRPFDGGHCCDDVVSLGMMGPAECPPEGVEAIGTAVYVNGDIMWDYRPTPTLVVPAHAVPRSRFPSIDVHCHWSADIDPEALLQAMDERNVARAINLSGGWGTTLDRMVERFLGRDPDRFVIFCNVDFGRAAEPNFGDIAAAEIRRAHAMGVRGIKVFKNLGLTTRDAGGRLIAIDDPRLDPVWATAGELGMPVLIHSADPVAFFRPIDGDNERWMQLRRHPDWSFHGEAFPAREAVLEQRSRMMERHPGTIFIGAHVANSSEDLAVASALLDRHPNLYCDISGRVGELGRQPYSARTFLTTYADRVLFGTDRYPGRPDQPRYRIYYRFLETADQYFKPYDHPFPPSGDWRIHGMYLPDDVLRKVYHANADRLFGWDTSAWTPRETGTESDASSPAPGAGRPTGDSPR